MMNPFLLKIILVCMATVRTMKKKLDQKRKTKRSHDMIIVCSSFREILNWLIKQVL
jgi:hypothetical protein